MIVPCLNAFALSGRHCISSCEPRVSLRLPWAMCLLGFQPALAKSETSFSLSSTLLPFQVGCSKSASKFDLLFAYFEPVNHWNTTNVVYVIWAVFEHFKKQYQKTNTISLIYNTLSVFLLNIWVSFLKPILNTLPYRALLTNMLWPRVSLRLPWARCFWAFSPCISGGKTMQKNMDFEHPT